MIGPSASGKSTLARLLVGVWPPLSPAACASTAPTCIRWNKVELGPHIGYLPQDIELFDGTVAENIARFGEIDAEKVVEAAPPRRHARPDPAVCRRLRHAVWRRRPARCPAASASASAWRARSTATRRWSCWTSRTRTSTRPGEAALVETVEGPEGGGSTVILITHRMSTLAIVDNVLVLQDGVSKAFGPRDKVLAPMLGARPGQPGPGPRPGVAPGQPGMPGVPGPGLPAPGAKPSGGGAPPAPNAA